MVECAHGIAQYNTWIVSVGHNPRRGNSFGQEVQKPEAPIISGPRFSRMSTETVDCNDAVIRLVSRAMVPGNVPMGKVTYSTLYSREGTSADGSCRTYNAGHSLNWAFKSTSAVVDSTEFASTRAVSIGRPACFKLEYIVNTTCWNGHLGAWWRRNQRRRSSAASRRKQISNEKSLSPFSMRGWVSHICGSQIPRVMDTVKSIDKVVKWSCKRVWTTSSQRKPT